ncbi:MAG: GNAT family N-acetyltransferase [Paracoccaceae bacterium]
MDIVRLHSTDARRLLPLLHQVHDLHVMNLPERYHPITTDQRAVDWLEEWLLQDAVYGFGAVSDGTLVGYAILEIEQKPETVLKHARTHAMLQHICVDAGHRRRGVAQALFRAAQAHLAPIGITDYGTAYASFNTSSAALMASLGFQPTMIYAKRKS